MGDPARGLRFKKKNENQKLHKHKCRLCKIHRILIFLFSSKLDRGDPCRRPRSYSDGEHLRRKRKARRHQLQLTVAVSPTTQRRGARSFEFDSGYSPAYKSKIIFQQEKKNRFSFSSIIECLKYFLLKLSILLQMVLVKQVK